MLALGLLALETVLLLQVDDLAAQGFELQAEFLDACQHLHLVLCHVVIVPAVHLDRL